MRTRVDIRQSNEAVLVPLTSLTHIGLVPQTGDSMSLQQVAVLLGIQRAPSNLT